MKIHFGTDGIRGKANEDLTIDMAYRIGQFVANSLLENQGQCKVLIGKDTRLSGDMFEMALASGLTSVGGDAYLLGVCSTPSLVYLVSKQDFNCGFMISASHNPYYDNGIKIITGSGTKMDSEFEKQIEEYIYGEEQLPLAIGENIGTVSLYNNGLDFYFDYLFKNFPLDLSNLKIALDCANGSSCVTAEHVLRHLKADVKVINNCPNGLNINRDCGSTHPESLVKFVQDNSCDVGFAFDGDADRVIAIAKDGQIVDGDKIIYACGKYFKKHNELRGNSVVTTVMANLGLFKKLDEYEIGYEKTAVGDKYVYENMIQNDYVIGGEQSGHIIFKDYASTGDGLLTALMILKVMLSEKKSLNELTDDLFIYPQLLVNVEVKDKEAMLENENVLKACQNVEEVLKGNGRVLVRPSGTEPLVRVMVEASSDELCSKYVNEIVEVVKNENK